MLKFLKVEGKDSLVRDTSSGAILNRDTEGLRAHLAEQAAAEDQRTEINRLKTQMERIEQLLTQLLNKE